MIQLTRPLVVLDFEATGVNPQEDRIISYAFVKFHSLGKGLETDLDTEEIYHLVNPGIPIPAASTEIHGITDDKVADLPTFGAYAPEIFHFIEGCDLAGFNIHRYDAPLMYSEFRRAGFVWDYTKHHIVDAGTIFKIKEERTLSAAYKFYCNQEIVDAHTALADTRATARVLQAQLDRYASSIPQTVEELAKYSNYGNDIADLSGKFVYKDGEVLFNFGKYKGERAKNHPDFLEWMLMKDFAPDTLSIVNRLLLELHQENLPF